MKKLVLISLINLISFLGNTQERSEIVRQRIEFISEQLESEDLDLTNIFDQLYYYLEHPINLNQASYQDLIALHLISDIQIRDLQNHIQIFGKFISIYELQTLPYWDLPTIQLILPFVRIDDKFDNLHVSLHEALRRGKSELFVRFQSTVESKKAYTEVSDSIKQNSSSYYYGNPNRYYTRFRYSYRTNLSVGFTAEKDPGEKFSFKNGNKGFDFYSVHAFYQGGKYFRALALGDYQVQIGQGLNLWSGYAFGKTADATNIKKNANPLKPYTSVDENRFLRGVAADFGYKKFKLLIFGSIKNVDATLIVDSLVEEQEFVSTINLSGFHRTTSEIARKGAFQEHIGGANLRYTNNRLSMGLASVYQGYNQNYNKKLYPYNQFDFRGKSFVSNSFEYSYVFRNMSFFGETSVQGENLNLANLHGVLIALDPNVSFSILHRNYERGYQTLYNAGFAEASSTQNEKGWYTGANIRLNSAWSIQSYADFFSFPWMKYLVEAPSAGHEYLIQPIFKPSKTMEVYFRFREQLREKNSRNFDGTVTEIEDVLQRNFRLNYSITVAEGIQLKSRIEYVTVTRKSNEKETGLLLYQDLILRLKSWPVDLSFRYAIFNTDSYDSRIYAYESNALYVFSVPGYYYKGSRAYVLVRYTLSRKIDMWARYSVNVYTDRMRIGTGAEEINGNQKSDITLQMRIKF
ncbi:MAG: helix-hairpin-helix domain-containing protein [Bacteroidetes bacterium]|nr:helix-hairpin-helix domain-containing protein [Bacteroidota bacterium]